MSNTTVFDIPPDVVSRTGPRILGYLFHFVLFGVLSMQVYLYYLAFPKDPRRNKFFVYSIYLLEVTQTLIITQSAYHVFGAGYGKFSYYDHVNTAWFSVPIISGLVAFLAEIFYAYRICILANSYWVPGLIFMLAMIQLGGAIGSAVVLKRAKLFSHLLNKPFFITEGIWNGGSALCDIIIAVCMLYYLWKRGRGTVKSTQVLLKRIITLVIETGAVTAAIAILNVVLVLLPNHPSYFETPSEVLAKVYSNSMMVVLNSRMRVGSPGSEVFSSTLSGSEFIFRVKGRSDTLFDTYGMTSEGVSPIRQVPVHLEEGQDSALDSCV